MASNPGSDASDVQQSDESRCMVVLSQGSADIPFASKNTNKDKQSRRVTSIPGVLLISQRAQQEHVTPCQMLLLFTFSVNPAHNLPFE